MVSGVDHHEARIGRVESDVGGIRQEMTALSNDVGSLKSDVKGLGSVLGRIEAGVLRSQERSEERETQGKPSLVAMVSVLITIISIIVGGAWVISGQLARQDAAIIKADQTALILVEVRNREIDQLRERVSHNEEHSWENRGRTSLPAPSN